MGTSLSRVRTGVQRRGSYSKKPEKTLDAEPPRGRVLLRIFAKEKAMAVKLYRTGYEHARKLVEEGVDDEAAEDTKGRYKFPYSDFEKVHRCALLSAESRAGRNKYFDIEKAAHELHQRIEKEKHAVAS
jgi:hypothetical protein